MKTFGRAILALALYAAPAVSQGADSTTLAALPEGTRIRTAGPAIREALPVTAGHVFRHGFASLIVRQAEGTVVAATPVSLRFVAVPQGDLVDVPWAGIDYVKTYRDRSIPIGLVQGALVGALSGLLYWGYAELIFGELGDVEDSAFLFVAVPAGAGALVGATTMGRRWDDVFP